MGCCDGTAKGSLVRVAVRYSQHAPDISDAWNGQEIVFFIPSFLVQKKALIFLHIAGQNRGARHLTCVVDNDGNIYNSQQGWIPGSPKVAEVRGASRPFPRARRAGHLRTEAILCLRTYLRRRRPVHCR
jgi:hypothetical protein